MISKIDNYSTYYPVSLQQRLLIWYKSSLLDYIKYLFLHVFFAVFEEPEDPTNRSFFSEIISSISDVKLSNSGRYMVSRDYLSVKVWDLRMETKPIESYAVSHF